MMELWRLSGQLLGKGSISGSLSTLFSIGTAAVHQRTHTAITHAKGGGTLLSSCIATIQRYLDFDDVNMIIKLIY